MRDVTSIARMLPSHLFWAFAEYGLFVRPSAHVEYKYGGMVLHVRVEPGRRMSDYRPAEPWQRRAGTLRLSIDFSRELINHTNLTDDDISRNIAERFALNETARQRLTV